MCLLCQSFITGDLDFIELALVDPFDMAITRTFPNYKLNPGYNTLPRVTPEGGVTPETVDYIP